MKQASQDSGDAGPAAREAADKGRLCGWRPTIATALTVGFGLLVVVAVTSVMWIALGAAQKNTVSLLRERAEFSVTSLIDQIGIHLGAARQQSEFLARNIARGQIDADDPEKLMEVMLGALAAAPQVTGIGFFSTDGWSLRVGHDENHVRRLYDAVEQDPSIIRLVKDTAPDSGSRWGGVFWVPSLGLPHLAISTPVVHEGRYLGVISSVVSIKALSHFVDDFQLQTGLHAFILYGPDRVLAHPTLIEPLPGLGDAKPLPGLAELDDPLLAAIWNDGRQPMDLLEGSNSSLLGHRLPLNEGEVYYLYRVIGGYGPRQLYMGIYARDKEIDSSEFDRLALAVWVGLGILIVSLIVAVILGRSIARPVRDLSTAAQAVSTFDFRRIAMTKGSVFQETDNAARAFNSMLSGLRWFETYVPRSLVLRLIQLGENGVQSEERQVTVIFTDIVGFTTASQKLTPHEIADFLNLHFGLLATEIERSGGTVDKYIGDSVMAFWGAPDEQPDHAERACRAALGIVTAVERDNVRRIAAGLPPVGLRVGIHSGPAIVGNIGAPGRVNYTLIGDTVNLANRLEAFGKEVPQRGAATVVLLSEDTAALLGPDWQVENLGAHQMRGRAGKIGVFRLHPGKTGTE